MDYNVSLNNKNLSLSKEEEKLAKKKAKEEQRLAKKKAKEEEKLAIKKAKEAEKLAIKKAKEEEKLAKKKAREEKLAKKKEKEDGSLTNNSSNIVQDNTSNVTEVKNLNLMAHASSNITGEISSNIIEATASKIIGDTASKIILDTVISNNTQENNSKNKEETNTCKKNIPDKIDNNSSIDEKLLYLNEQLKAYREETKYKKENNIVDDEDIYDDDSDTDNPYLILLGERKISVSINVDFIDKIDPNNIEESDNIFYLNFVDYDYDIRYKVSSRHDISGEWQIYIDSNEYDTILGCWRIDDNRDNEPSGENGTPPWWHRRSTFNPMGKKIDDGGIAYSYGKIGIKDEIFSKSEFDLIARATTRAVEGLYTNNLKRLWEDMNKKGKIVVEGLVMLTNDEDFPFIEAVSIGTL